MTVQQSIQRAVDSIVKAAVARARADIAKQVEERRAVRARRRVVRKAPRSTKKPAFRAGNLQREEPVNEPKTAGELWHLLRQKKRLPVGYVNERRHLLKHIGLYGKVRFVAQQDGIYAVAAR